MEVSPVTLFDSFPQQGGKSRIVKTEKGAIGGGGGVSKPRGFKSCLVFLGNVDQVRLSVKARNNGNSSTGCWKTASPSAVTTLLNVCPTSLKFSFWESFPHLFFTPSLAAHSQRYLPQIFPLLFWLSTWFLSFSLWFLVASSWLLFFDSPRIFILEVWRFFF